MKHRSLDMSYLLFNLELTAAEAHHTNNIEKLKNNCIEWNELPDNIVATETLDSFKIKYGHHQLRRPL
ncbi:hypothetical protein BpHYR1_035970 [Brachionus plicatilis]|uniref:RNA-directed DNA polymerase from mobile element jockey-like n=1 Tax=Brachionus plicatilis TaxID=10195 RepID=A0A3M7QT13_BRAPC|nr:hypothetical protein BpHYR1_035970 [Brachionus plicatilis]